MKMHRSIDAGSSTALRAAAAEWIVRRDRGLSATEAEEFERWLSADPQHVAALERCTTAWRLLGQMPAEVAAESDADTVWSTRHRYSAMTCLGAAAALVVAGLGWWRWGRPAKEIPGTAPF